MTFLTYILLTISGAVSMAGAYDKPLSNDEIISIVTDCSNAGLVYNNVSSLTPGIGTGFALVDSSDSGEVTSLPMSREREKQRLSASGYVIYDQWCDAPSSHSYSGKRSYFKPALTHTVMINELNDCRRSQGVADGTPVDLYAIVTVGNMSLQPTKIDCKIE